MAAELVDGKRRVMTKPVCESKFHESPGLLVGVTVLVMEEARRENGLSGADAPAICDEPTVQRDYSEQIIIRS